MSTMSGRHLLYGIAAAFLLTGLGVSVARAADPAAALAALQNKILVTGSHGEQASPIAMHYGGNDWSRAQVQALRAQFGMIGIKVIAVTDAGFKAAADHGIKLVFMNFAPNGMVAGKDYVSVVSADEYGNGVASAHLMAQALGGTREVGLVFHAADFNVTRQRDKAVKATFAEDYPRIKIVAEQGIGGPDFSGDGEKAASAMLTEHPRIKGIWAVWDVPAEGVISAARNAGRDDLVITTIDLGENVAIDMAQGGFVKGLGAQRVYDQGVTEALLAGYGLLGKTAPAYVAAPALPVTKENLLASSQTVYHAPATAKISKSMN